MIQPIKAIGFPVLKQVAEPLNKAYPKLDELVENMFETMYNAQGIGLAAPQIGLSIRLFIVDTGFSLTKGKDKETGVKEVFINPEIVELYGEMQPFEEGCLSIPTVREEIFRPEGVAINYLNKNFEPKSLRVEGLLSRVIQHENDHIDGILFTDLLQGLKKRMIKPKLEKISKGKVKVNYPMRFPLSKR